MKQLNMVLPSAQEDHQSADGEAFEEKAKQGLLGQVRSNFGIFGGASLLFGGFFTLFFYKTGIGVNVLLFCTVIIILMILIMKKLALPMKTGTKFYYTGVILLGISSFYTSSGILQLLNILGILFLLDLSLLHQFYDDDHWNFVKHTGRMFGMVLYSIASMGMPFIDGVNFLKHTKFLKNDLLRNILLGIAASIPALLLTTALLSNADLMFGRLTKNIFNVIFSADIFGILFMILFGAFACYCILCGSLFKEGRENSRAAMKADASIAATFMVILCLVYAVFCGIQVVYLFSHGIAVLPAEFTFAQYARRGFFELLAVTFINIILMLICRFLFRESRLLSLLVVFMTACTYIMIASAVYRMFLYIGVYHLTFLRLFVLLTLLIDFFVLAGIIVSEYKRDMPLFRYCVAVISVCYIVFSFARPDYYIASYLAANKKVLTIEDMRYLTTDLSLDASPAVSKIIGDLKQSQVNSFKNETTEYEETYQDLISCYYIRIDNAKNHMKIRNFNYSCYKAGNYASE